MLNLVRSLYAAQYSFRVALNLGPNQEAVTASLAYARLVRRARINGLKAKQCAQMFRSIVDGASGVPMDAAMRAVAINAAMESMESNESMWAGLA